MENRKGGNDIDECDTSSSSYNDTNTPTSSNIHRQNSNSNAHPTWVVLQSLPINTSASTSTSTSIMHEEDRSSGIITNSNRNCKKRNYSTVQAAAATATTTCTTNTTSAATTTVEERVYERYRKQVQLEEQLIQYPKNRIIEPSVLTTTISKESHQSHHNTKDIDDNDKNVKISTRTIVANVEMDHHIVLRVTDALWAYLIKVSKNGGTKNNSIRRDSVAFRNLIVNNVQLKQQQQSLPLSFYSSKVNELKNKSSIPTPVKYYTVTLRNIVNTLRPMMIGTATTNTSTSTTTRIGSGSTDGSNTNNISKRDIVAVLYEIHFSYYYNDNNCTTTATTTTTTSDNNDKSSSYESCWITLLDPNTMKPVPIGCSTNNEVLSVLSPNTIVQINTLIPYETIRKQIISRRMTTSLI